MKNWCELGERLKAKAMSRAKAQRMNGTWGEFKEG